MKELIESAREKGFKTILEVTDPKTPKDFDSIDLCNYLWLCELKKWLRDEYRIFAYIDWYTFEYVFVEHGKGIVRESIPNITNDINDWENWLPGLLTEALKLI